MKLDTVAEQDIETLPWIPIEGVEYNKLLALKQRFLFLTDSVNIVTRQVKIKEKNAVIVEPMKEKMG